MERQLFAENMDKEPRNSGAVFGYFFVFDKMPLLFIGLSVVRYIPIIKLAVFTICLQFLERLSAC